MESCFSISRHDLGCELNECDRPCNRCLKCEFQQVGWTLRTKASDEKYFYSKNLNNRILSAYAVWNLGNTRGPKKRDLKMRKDEKG
jgi:hypothetical protein